ncbi:MAG: GntR family transcriptional regulator [Clostridiales bacterium]|nr:GntR family transcriptional regulator [Clostridiales bacterium]
MTILINPSSPTPLYEQIVDQIKRQIINGSLPQGTPLPSIRALAAQVSVSIITTKRAYEELERDGYIQTLPGRGSIVSAQNRQRLMELHLREMEGLLEKAVSAAKAAGIGREELIQTLSIIYGEED